MGVGIAAMPIRRPRDGLQGLSTMGVMTNLIDERLEGSMTLEFIMDTGKEGGLRDPQLLGQLDELATTTLAIEGDDGLRAGKTISLSDVVKEIYRALNEDRPEFYSIPEDTELLAQEMLFFENSGTDDLTELVDSQFESGSFTILLAALRLPRIHRIGRVCLRGDVSGGSSSPSDGWGHALGPRHDVEHDPQ
jgi:hypothetical protein